MLKIFETVTLGVASLMAVTTAPAFATQHTNGVQPGVVTVSCFRGPWEEVIWDRPNAIFIDSLVALGYSYTEANGIGERVCRDEATVDNEAAARAVMMRILADNPPR